MSRGVRWQPKTLTPDFLAPFDFPWPLSTTNELRHRISLGWGVGINGGPGLGVGRYPAAAGRKPARGVGRYALARGVSDRYGTVTRPLRQLAATRDS